MIMEGYWLLGHCSLHFKAVKSSSHSTQRSPKKKQGKIHRDSDYLAPVQRGCNAVHSMFSLIWSALNFWMTVIHATEYFNEQYFSPGLGNHRSTFAFSLTFSFWVIPLKLMVCKPSLEFNKLMLFLHVSLWESSASLEVQIWWIFPFFFFFNVDPQVFECMISWQVQSFKTEHFRMFSCKTPSHQEITKHRSNALCMLFSCRGLRLEV